MIYLSITQIDADTGIICTAEPMRTGPSYPKLKNWNVSWWNESTWPIATTLQGVHTAAPLFYGTCDDDADLSVTGVVSQYTAEEYLALKTVEHQARKPYPSWIGTMETMSWEAPAPYINDGNHYSWSEEQLSWIPV